jgi:hypothetical protein
VRVDGVPADEVVAAIGGEGTGHVHFR